MHITTSLASIVTNELVAEWYITKRVKRLAGNEIELGMKIPTIESWASNILMTREQRMLLCSLTDKDLRRICRSQYEHPCSTIGYWSEMCLDHVYIVLEPVVSARNVRWRFVLWFTCFWWPKFVQSPGWDHGHDEESRNGREVKIDTRRWHSDTRRVSECTG